MDVALAIKRLAVTFIPVLLGIILHEIAHGYAAYRCGDDTAKRLGRLSLNPLAHIDPIGLAFFVLTGLFAPITLGWAKPVPIDPRNFRNVTKDIAKVSLAGPVTNFVLAVLFAIVFKIIVTVLPYAVYNTSTVYNFLLLMLYSGITINLALCFFNLIPVPPLDGSKLLWCVLPPKWGFRLMQFERYGIFVVILLAASNLLTTILLPPVEYSLNLILSIFGLN